MGPCIVEIDRIVRRIVQYQLEVNRCRNEEIIVKGNFVWVWPILGGAPQVEIDRIVIREVQYYLEVNLLKGNFGWVWPMWVGRLRVGNGAMHIEIDRIVIRESQYQFEVNRCRNEEIIHVVKGNFGWVWSMWAGRPRVGNDPCIVEVDRIIIREVQYQFELRLTVLSCIVDEIDRIVIRESQYQFEVNRCGNEEIIVKGNFGWVWSMWAGRPRVGYDPCIVEIDRIVIREVQYQFEVNQCRNKET
ncbi:hypothetical protein DPMN_180744 [Dreissena polymorpha]|uniref:Uncharacterized protein n=1 Tax=Dreissena polymorpha TaxID=45954 RepID=A0A9D4I4N4_DREPO|nr:hypothetical protein DPMN_180744 [Dreissena polymorpha]